MSEEKSRQLPDLKALKALEALKPPSSKTQIYSEFSEAIKDADLKKVQYCIDSKRIDPKEFFKEHQIDISLCMEHSKPDMFLYLFTKAPKESSYETYFATIADRIAMTAAWELEEKRKVLAVLAKEEIILNPIYHAAYLGEVEELDKEIAKVSKEEKATVLLNLLCMLAANGHTKIIDRLVKTHDLDVDQFAEVGGVPLIWAARGGHYDAGKLLVDDFGAKVTILDEASETALMRSASKGDEKLVRYLAGKSLVDNVNKDGNSALMLAVSGNHKHVVKCLLEDYKANLHLKNKEGIDAFIMAVCGGYLEIVKYLYENHKIDVEAETNQKVTAFFLAAYFGHLEVLKYLHETCHAKRDVRDEKRNNALMVAARKGHAHLLEYLIETCKFKVNYQNRNGNMPLICAIESGDLEAVRFLVEKYGAVFKLKNKFNHVVYMWSAFVGQTHIMAYFINVYKMKPNARLRINGETMISLAARAGHLHAVKYLYEVHNVDLEFEDRRGDTPLKWAAYNGKTEVVDYLISLLSAGVVSYREVRMDAFYQAALNGQEELVKHLMREYGADPYKAYRYVYGESLYDRLEENKKIPEESILRDEVQLVDIYEKEYFFPRAALFLKVFLAFMPDELRIIIVSYLPEFAKLIEDEAFERMRQISAFADLPVFEGFGHRDLLEGISKKVFSQGNLNLSNIYLCVSEALEQHGKEIAGTACYGLLNEIHQKMKTYLEIETSSVTDVSSTFFSSTSLVVMGGASTTISPESPASAPLPPP